MSEHTKTPWHVEAAPRADWELCWACNGEPGHVALFPDTGEADARRCAACVNALADIPTDVLEAFGHRAIARQSEAFEGLLAACEQALAFVEEIYGIYKLFSPKLRPDGKSETMEPVRLALIAAIANAKESRS